MDELYPLTQNNDFHIFLVGYNLESDTLYLEIEPRVPHHWADVAYQFSQQEGMKYDRDTAIYPVDGQPRVSYSGLVWVRYKGDFEGGAKVALSIQSELPSHSDAEEQLARFYGLYKDRNGQEPIDVLRRYL
jgi:hypothetical protein